MAACAKCMLEKIRDLLFEHISWAVLVPWLAALYNRHTLTAPLRVIGLYFTVAVCTQSISFILWKLKINNLPVLHVYTVVEYLLLLWYFSIVLSDFLPRRVFVLLAVCFPLLSVADSLFVEKIYSFNTYSRSTEALILIFLAVCWFVKTVSVAEMAANMPLHYVTAGLLIYFAGSVVLFSFRDLISQLNRTFLMNVWSIHTLLLLIFYTLTTIALWKHRKR